MDLIQFMLILAIVGAIAYCIWRWVPMPPAFKTGFLWFVGIAVAIWAISVILGIDILHFHSGIKLGK